MKTVLLIKIEAPGYSSVGLENAFKEHFQEVHSIDWQSINFNNHGEIWPEINAKCLEVMPHLIFCQFQKEKLKIDQWKKLAKYGYVINYTEDVREDTTWYEEVAPHIGLTIFTNIDDVEKLQAKGIMNVAYLPVSYNDVWYKQQQPTEKYYGDIIFLGQNYVGSNLNFPQAQQRQDMVKFMKETYGDKFQAYGLGQENQMLTYPHNVEALNNCKIAITHSNFKRKGYCSDRNLNALACGAITIQQEFEGAYDMFKDCPTLTLWSKFDELEMYCNYFLHAFEMRIKAIHDLKRDWAMYIKIHHTWKSRVRDIIELMAGRKPRRIRIHEFD